MVKNPSANAGDVRDTGSILGLGRSPGGGHGNSLQYSCQENSTDRGAWRATVHWVMTEGLTPESSIPDTRSLCEYEWDRATVSGWFIPAERG